MKNIKWRLRSKGGYARFIKHMNTEVLQTHIKDLVPNPSGFIHVLATEPRRRLTTAVHAFVELD